jgi:RNA polymerase sigma-70 factor (ECF subfamily)
MDDAELVMRLKHYDPEAVREVVANHGTALHRYAASITGDAHVAEDIVSETYLRMLEHISTYVYTGAPFHTWLYRIAHNLALNAIRRERPASDEQVLEQLAAPDDDPEQLVQQGEEQAELRQALLALTEEQQQVLLLRFAAGHSTAEVARTLQKSEGSVKQLQLRGLRSLARVLRRAEVSHGVQSGRSPGRVPGTHSAR